MMMTKNRCQNCVQTVLINEKIQIGKRGLKTEQTGRSPLTRRSQRWIVVPLKRRHNIHKILIKGNHI